MLKFLKTSLFSAVFVATSLDIMLASAQIETVYKPAVESSITQEKSDRKIGILNAEIRSVHFSFDFKNWEPNNLHWNPPSNFEISQNGKWYFYAKHIANMRRTGGIFDTGQYRTWLVTITYWDGWDAKNEKCAGSVIHARDYILRGLNYKQQDWDVSSRATDSVYSNVANRVRCARAQRWIR